MQRKPDHYVELRVPTAPPKVPPEFAREAVGRGERPAAPSALGQTPTRTTAPQGGAQPQKFAHDVGKIERSAEKAAAKATGILGRGILGALAGLFKLFDLFPAKPPSPEQQDRNHRAAEEKQAAQEMKAEKDERLQEILRQISRDDQERARQRRERGGRDDDGGRERDRGYER